MAKRRKRNQSYPNDLGSKKHEIQYLNGEIVLSDECIKDIIKSAEKTLMGQSESAIADLCEVIASNTIIGWFMGVEYMDKAMKPFYDEDGCLKERDDLGYVPAQYIRDRDKWPKIMKFSQYLESIIDCKGFHTKTDELSGRDFDSCLFELKVASTLVDNGCKLIFVSTSNEKTVEFLVDDKIKVECKRKKGFEGEKSIRNSIENFIYDTLKKLKDDHGFLTILIETEDKMTLEEIQILDKITIEVINTIMLDYENFSEKMDGIIIWNEYTDINKKLNIQSPNTRMIFYLPGNNYSLVENKIIDSLEGIRYTPNRKFWIDYHGAYSTKLNRNTSV